MGASQEIRRPNAGYRGEQIGSFPLLTQVCYLARAARERRGSIPDRALNVGDSSSVYRKCS